jgi:hypothetical protein
MSNDSPCDGLQALLSGTFGETYIRDIEEAREHWSACEQCRGMLPEAENHLKFIEDELLRRIRVNIEQFYHRHCASENTLTANRNTANPLTASCTVNFLEAPMEATPVLRVQTRVKPKEPDENTQRLLLLAEAGQAVQAQLQVMNDNWGLDYFHLLRTDSEYSSTKCGPLISSLPYNTQLFVYQSILAMDSVEDCETETVIQLGSRLHTLVVNAAPAFTKAFPEQHSPAGVGNSRALEADRSRLLRVCDNLEQHLDDVADSLKAGQMEMIRRWEKSGARAKDMEPYLDMSLGPLYPRLAGSTKRELQLAEYYYSQNQEPDDFTPAVMSFHRAYEAEFKLRVLAPLEARLNAEGMRDYGDERPRLMVKGRLNPSLGLGQVLHYLHDDMTVSKYVKELGFDVDKIYRRSSELNNARNQAVHGQQHTRKNAEAMRNLLLGQPSILSHLFKETVA